MSTGRYITLEGAEGCGKGTHAARLADALDAVLTRETGGTAIGQRIRTILHDTTVTNLSHRAEALLTAADRAQHIDEIVAPALISGRHVVSDRSVYSTLAYQGYGRELPLAEVRRLNEWAVGTHWPHLVLLLDAAPEVLERRMRGRQLDRFEQEGDDFHRRVRDGFRQMAVDEPARWVTIDGSQSLDAVARAIRGAVKERLGQAESDNLMPHDLINAKPISAAKSVWDGVVGQPRAVQQLTRSAAAPVHAYLFVGPAGSTKHEAARAFAALLLTGHDDPDARDARLALAGEHPDVREVERTGARISKDQVSEIIRNASMAPIEGSRKVMLLHEFHLLEADGAARLLKTIEEPPASAVFIVLADQVPPELVTVASRCVRIEFSTIPEATIRDVLIAEGATPAAAGQAAAAAAGNLTRARVLATDPGLTARHEAFATVPQRLDGTGSNVVALCTELNALIDAAAAPLAARQEEEASALEARVAAVGERGSGRKQLEERHKRELRRHRVDELRSGLGVMAGAYRDALVQQRAARPDAAVHAVQRIHQALDALERNPNETLLLQALLLDLPTI